jgi:hypothetical protein
MKRVMVRYKVKADRAAENENYISKVFEQLKNDRPSGLRYASFKLNDGVSFVHIVSIDAPDGSNPLGELSAFKVFIRRMSRLISRLSPEIAQIPARIWLSRR